MRDLIGFLKCQVGNLSVMFLLRSKILVMQIKIV
jgi:hypothetical protein